MRRLRRVNAHSSRRHLATKRSHKKVMARSRKFYLQTEVGPMMDMD
ncbi:hypothetical protein ACFSJ3_02605 [Corallincola platygyrae]|uniref:Uncharacterized protein n=1 Tax=Corallincola platygyrae TaxID=1193278 RepID=A0ABW4XJA8_9GAMM